MAAKGLAIVAVLALGFLMAGCGSSSCGTGYACSVSPGNSETFSSGCCETCSFTEERAVNGQDYQINDEFMDCSCRGQ